MVWDTIYSIGVLLEDMANDVSKLTATVFVRSVLDRCKAVTKLVRVKTPV